MLHLFITKGFLFLWLNFKPILVCILVGDFKGDFTYVGLLAVFCSNGEVSIVTDSGLDGGDIYLMSFGIAFSLSI